MLRMAQEARWQDRTDAELVASVDAWPEAFRELHRRHAPVVFRWARRRVEESVAEELVQDVLLAAWQKRSTFDPARGTFPSWLLGIAHHRLVNEFRRRGRAPVTSAPDELDAPAPQVGDSPDAAWAEYRKIAVRSALERLPAAQRQAVSLAFLGELTHEEIAQVLAVPLGTAKTRIRSGLMRLAPALSALVATAAAVLAFEVWRSRERELGLRAEDRALRSITQSDTELIHVAAAPGVPAEQHGSFRKPPQATIGVMTFSNLPPLVDQRYQAYGRFGARWIWLAEPVLDASRHGLAVIENDALRERPSELRVTRESGRPSEPSGEPVLEWLAP